MMELITNLILKLKEVQSPYTQSFLDYLAQRGSKRFGLKNVPTKFQIRLLRDWIIRFCLSRISFFIYDANV